MRPNSAPRRRGSGREGRVFEVFEEGGDGLVEHGAEGVVIFFEIVVGVPAGPVGSTGRSGRRVRRGGGRGGSLVPKSRVRPSPRP